MSLRGSAVTPIRNHPLIRYRAPDEELLLRLCNDSCQLLIDLPASLLPLFPGRNHAFPFATLILGTIGLEKSSAVIKFLKDKRPNEIWRRLTTVFL